MKLQLWRSLINRSTINSSAPVHICRTNSIGLYCKQEIFHSWLSLSVMSLLWLPQKAEEVQRFGSFRSPRGYSLCILVALWPLFLFEVHALPSRDGHSEMKYCYNNSVYLGYHLFITSSMACASFFCCYFRFASFASFACPCFETMTKASLSFHFMFHPLACRFCGLVTVIRFPHTIVYSSILVYS